MRSVLSLFLLLAAFAASAQAQAALGFGGISGSIVDDYGDGIPDVRVVLTNTKMGIVRRFSTTDDGIFNFTSLIPGTGYVVKSTRKGYGDFEIRNIEVKLGQITGFVFSIEPDEPARSLDAREMIPQDAMSRLGASANLTPEQIANVPQPERRWEGLLDMVFPPWPANFTPSALHGGISQPSIEIDPNPTYQEPSGRMESPMVLVDGVDQTNYYMVKTQPLLLSQEAVQEAEVVSKTYASEYPGSMGGIVSVLTRSGENQFHAAAYDYWRDHEFNARGRYAPAWFTPPQHENQTGLSLSGPILKNKLYFYGDGEYMQGYSVGLNTITNQIIADPQGKGVVLSNCTATTSQCSAAAKFINSQMNKLVPRRKHSDFGFAKIDYRRSDRHTVTLTAGGSSLMDQMNARTDLVATDGGLIGQNGNVRHDTRYVHLSWTSKPTTHSFNDIRLGWSRDDLLITDSPWLFPSTGALGILVAGASIGAPSMYPDSIRQRRRFFSESFSAANNTHAARVGVNIQRSGYSITGANFAGTYSYPTLTAFAQDFSGVTSGRKTYTSFYQQLGYDDRAYPFTVLNGYAQDTWRVSSHITLNYGLSWERPFMPKAPAVDTVQYWTGYIPSPNINAMPRFGLAMRLSDSTVLRASWAMIYAPYSAEILDAQVLGNALILPSFSVTPQMTAATNSNQTDAPVFPNAYTWFGGPPSASRNSFFAVHKMRIPHSNQEMLALEHSFDPSTSLTASAIVSRGYSLWNVYDLNLAKPTRGANYGIDDVNGKNVGLFSTPIWTTVTNANYAHIYNVDNGDSSWYAGLTAQFKRRFSQNLSVEADYTWSHAIDDIGNPIGGLAGAASYDNATRNDMGPSQFDRRHRANITFVWQPKVGKNVMPVARQLLNDWQISGFATIATNPPFTPTLIVQGQQLSGQATLYTNSLNGSGGWNNVPWESIGSLRWGIMAPVNLRLTRTLRFGERLKAQLSFEAYNALNTQYNTSLNTIGYIVKSAIAKPVANVGTGNAAWGWIDGTNARRAQVSLRLSF